MLMSKLRSRGQYVLERGRGPGSRNNYIRAQERPAHLAKPEGDCPQCLPFSLREHLCQFVQQLLRYWGLGRNQDSPSPGLIVQWAGQTFQQTVMNKC